VLLLQIINLLIVSVSGGNNSEMGVY